MSLLDYHKSTTKELLALTSKVRDLVSHWGEDGRYKEAILKNVIRRFLPDKYLIATGFVVRQTGTRGEHRTSRQIDLIVYDIASPVLFREGDFVILTPDAVKGIVEVKANLQNQGIDDVLRKANVNGQFIFDGKSDSDENFFNGIFSFDGYNTSFDMSRLIHSYQSGNIEFESHPNYEKFKVNHVSLNKDWFIKFWPGEALPHSIYNIKDLSFSFFISNLIDSASDKSVNKNNFIWYATDKEINNTHQF